MKKILSFILLIFATITSLAQITIPGDIPSPNAAELGEFGNVPVSYYTGKANITIPLYSLSAMGITLPVYLAYNSGGVQVNKLPSWTGDNWALCAGGVITRVRQGQYDELIYPSTMGNFVLQKTMRNYFQSHHSLQMYMNNPVNNYRQLKDSVSNDLRDLAPDLYYFNFMGHVGQFFLGNDGQWKVCSDENLEVIFDYEDTSNFIPPFFSNYPPPYSSVQQPKTIKGFLIRDATGTEYHFGGNSDYIEYTLPLRFQGDYEGLVSWAASSWYLREVRNRHGNTLFTLNYERGYYIVQLYNNAYVAKQSNSTSGLVSATLHSNYGGIISFPYDGVINSPIYLTSIVSADGEEIEFSSSDWDKKPELIYYNFYASYQTYNNLLTSMGMGAYAYYYLSSEDTEPKQYQYRTDTGKNSENPKYNPLFSMRLRKLDAVKLLSANGSVVSKNSLAYFLGDRLRLSKIYIYCNNQIEGRYDLTYSPASELEDYLSRLDDHWGYLTGNNYTLPEYNNTNGHATFYNQRNPTLSSTKGMLTQIVYPTGGRCVFEYENHDFSKYVLANRLGMVDSTSIAGGVRIKSITEYDDSSNQHKLRKRTFTYIDPSTGCSSGQLYGLPRYYWNCWQAYNRSSDTQSYLSLFKNTSILPLSSSFGPHVGYSFVRETFDDGTYKEYRYSNFSTAKDYSFILDFSNGTPSPYDLYSSQEYKRGKLLSVRICDAEDTPKQLKEFQYRTNNVESNYVLATNLTCENYVNVLLNSFDHFTGGVYKLFYPKYDVEHEITTTYYHSGTITDTMDIEHEDYNLTIHYGNYSHLVDFRLTKSETMKRGSTIAQTIYTYPFNEVSTANGLLPRYQFYLQPLVAEQKLNGVTIKKTKTSFMDYQGLLVPKCELEWKNGLAVDTLVTYLTYDTTFGNPLTYRELGEPTTTLKWSSDGCRLEEKTSGNSHTEKVYYDTANRPYYIRSINGNATYFEYDRMGRISAIKGLNGKEKEFFYNYKNK